MLVARGTRKFIFMLFGSFFDTNWVPTRSLVANDRITCILPFIHSDEGVCIASHLWIKELPCRSSQSSKIIFFKVWHILYYGGRGYVREGSPVGISGIVGHRESCLYLDYLALDTQYVKSTNATSKNSRTRHCKKWGRSRSDQNSIGLFYKMTRRHSLWHVSKISHSCQN